MVCQSFCSQGGGRCTPRQTSPLGRRPRGQIPHLLGNHSPWADAPGKTAPLGREPPWADVPGGRHPLADAPHLGRHAPDTAPDTTPSPKTTIAADGRHPTGMHSYVTNCVCFTLTTAACAVYENFFVICLFGFGTRKDTLRKVQKILRFCRGCQKIRFKILIFNCMRELFSVEFLVFQVTRENYYFFNIFGFILSFLLVRRSDPH